MNGAFYVGATGLRADQQALDLIANNIANMNTTAFKRSEVRFSELMSASDPAQRVGSAGLAQAGAMGVATNSIESIAEQGDLQTTGKPMDLAINGDGFIELLGPDGQSRLWRGGTLKINADGALAAANGLPLKAAITVPSGATNLAIAADGTVQAQLEGNADPQEIGKIDLVMVKDVSSLTNLGGGVYATDDDAELSSVTPQEDGSGALVQGSLESSNVDMSNEMVTLLMMQRAYAANAQVLQAGDQLMSIANGLRR